MADQAELAFAKTFLNTLSTQPIIYGNDYQQPPHNSLKRIPVFPVTLPPPPKKHHAESSGTSTTAPSQITLTFKSLKPAASYTLTISPTDTIATIKSQLATSHPTAPPADAQRLLVKGKALADGKLLKEYNIQQGDTVNLIVKSEISWDPSKPKSALQPQPQPSPSKSSSPMSSSTLSVNVGDSGSQSQSGAGVSSGRGTRHSRTPSIVLSPSPSSDALRGAPEKDILLTLDSAADLPSQVPVETLSAYHNTLAKPEFWQKLLAFLRQEFTSENDVLHAWEDFLRASKGYLTASEIAKIRDFVGVVGMAGT